MLARAHKGATAKPVARRAQARRPRARAGARAPDGGAAPASHQAAPTHAPTVVQAKLRVSEPGDALEREADRVADEVVGAVASAAAATAPPAGDGRRPAGPAATVARACASCGPDEDVQRLDEDRIPIEGEPLARACASCGPDEDVQRLDEDRIPIEGEPLARACDDELDRACAACDDELDRACAACDGELDRACAACDDELDRACAACDGELDRAPAGRPGAGLTRTPDDTLVATPVLETEIAALRRHGGRPLAAPLRAALEPAMDADLGAVRIHTGPRAAHAAALARAHAFTVGHDVVFAADRFRPTTRAGLHLLAHELAHTVQQAGAVSRKPLPRVKHCAATVETDSVLRIELIADLTLRAIAGGQTLGIHAPDTINTVQAFLRSRVCDQVDAAALADEQQNQVMGPESARALNAYQVAKNVTLSGQVDTETVRAMEEDLQIAETLASCRPPKGHKATKPRKGPRVVPGKTTDSDDAQGLDPP